VERTGRRRRETAAFYREKLRTTPRRDSISWGVSSLPKAGMSLSVPFVIASTSRESLLCCWKSGSVKS